METGLFTPGHIRAASWRDNAAGKCTNISICSSFIWRFCLSIFVQEKSLLLLLLLLLLLPSSSSLFCFLLLFVCFLFCCCCCFVFCFDFASSGCSYVGSLFSSEEQKLKGWLVAYSLILLTRIVALFMTSLTRTARQKTCSTHGLYRRLLNIDTGIGSLKG